MNGGYFCQPCDKIFSGEAPYNAHLASEKHKKKMNSIKLGDSPQSISNYLELKLDEYIQKFGSDFKCTVCNVIMNDLSTATSHVKGQKHLKTTARLSSTCLEVNSTDSPNIELDPNVKKCGTEYICSACNVFMNDISVVSSHLKGQKHLKTLAKLNISFGSLTNSFSKENSNFNSFNSVCSLDENSSDIVSESSKCVDLEFKLDQNIVKKGLMYECKVCNVIMNDISTATSHAVGQKHLKTLAKLNISFGSLTNSFSKENSNFNSFNSVCSLDENSSDIVSESSKCGDLEYKLDQNIVKKGLMYECKVCNAIMNDISTATSHAVGQKHLKAISKLKGNTSQFLNTNASGSNLDSLKSIDQLEYKLDQFIEKSGIEYKCIGCNVFMNDISSAASHVRGQKHLKNICRLNNSQNSLSSNITALPESELSLDSSDSSHSVKNLMDSTKYAFNDSFLYDSCIEKLGNDSVCHACNVFMNSDSTIKSHLSGQKHLKNKLYYKRSPNDLDGIHSVKPNNLDSVDCEDVYLFNKKISFSAYSVEDVTKNVQVFGVSEPVTF